MAAEEFLCGFLRSLVHAFGMKWTVDGGWVHACRHEVNSGQ
jgi:hypothetical protein